MPKTVDVGTRKRLEFSRIETTIPIPNLLDLQRESYRRFLQMELLPEEPGVVDYDSRPRDRELQRNPYVALRRLHLLVRRLDDWAGASLDAPVQVRGLGGLAGDFGFAVISSLARELVFAASHAIHHYALLKPHCIQLGIPISAEFGRAPSTVAYQSASLTDRLAA